MQFQNNNHLAAWITTGLLAGSMLLTSCSPDTAGDTATDEPLVQTAQAILTEKAVALPSNTPEPLPPASTTPSPTITLAAFTTSTPQTVAASWSGSTTLCDQAGFISDVTIADGTEISAGTTFTKTWQLRNDGTCTWTEAYMLVFSSGEQMSGIDSATFTTSSIAPGGTVSISVELTAPDEAGTAVGYWLLQNASGTNFGIGASGLPFYVEIVVTDAESTSTPTATSTTDVSSNTDATLTPTASATASATATEIETTVEEDTPAPTATFTPDAADTSEDSN